MRPGCSAGWARRWWARSVAEPPQGAARATRLEPGRPGRPAGRLPPDRQCHRDRTLRPEPAPRVSHGPAVRRTDRGDLRAGCRGRGRATREPGAPPRVLRLIGRGALVTSLVREHPLMPALFAAEGLSVVAARLASWRGPASTRTGRRWSPAKPRCSG